MVHGHSLDEDYLPYYLGGRGITENLTPECEKLLRGLLEVDEKERMGLEEFLRDEFVVGWEWEWLEVDRSKNVVGGLFGVEKKYGSKNLLSTIYKRELI